MAQELSTRIGSKPFQMFGGLPTVSQAPSSSGHESPERQPAPQVFDLSLSPNGPPSDTDRSNSSYPDPQYGRTSEPSERARPIFPVNIAIADKNPMVLSALEALLTRDRRFNLLLMASDGLHFLNSLNSSACQSGGNRMGTSANSRARNFAGAGQAPRRAENCRL